MVLRVVVSRVLCISGADVIGVNCYFDPDACLQTIRTMKEALDEAGIKKHLITQPIGYKTPECMDGSSKVGFTGLDEFPLGKKNFFLLL